MHTIRVSILPIKSQIKCSGQHCWLFLYPKVVGAMVNTEKSYFSFYSAQTVFLLPNNVHGSYTFDGVWWAKVACVCTQQLMINEKMEKMLCAASNRKMRKKYHIKNSQNKQTVIRLSKEKTKEGEREILNC